MHRNQYFLDEKSPMSLGFSGGFFIFYFVIFAFFSFSYLFAAVIDLLLNLLPVQNL